MLARNKRPGWIISGIVLATAIVALLSWLASFVPASNYQLNRAIDLFTGFGGAAIAATVAAIFVVYQARKAHDDLVEQEEVENQLQQGADFNRVRPMLYLIVKTNKHWVRGERILPGDQVLAASAGLDRQTAAEFVDHVNQERSVDTALLELRFFYGEPIHRVRIRFAAGTRMGGVLYIPYLESDRRHIVVTGDMFQDLPGLEDARAAEQAVIDAETEEHHERLPYAKPKTQVPLETTVKALMAGDIEIEFDTVLQEHVKVTYAYDADKGELSEGAIELSYNNPETTAFMDKQIKANRLPNEEHVTVCPFERREKPISMQKTTYTVVYTVPEQ